MPPYLKPQRLSVKVTRGEGTRRPDMEGIAMPYIVDTDIVNRLLDGSVRLEELPSDQPIVAPRTQLNQVKRVRNRRHRAQLMLKLSELRLKRISMGSIVLNGSYRQDVKLWDSTLFKKLMDDFGRLCRSRSNARDILLAELAIINRLTFLTRDRCLANIVNRHGGRSVHFKGRVSGRRFALL